MELERALKDGRKLRVAHAEPADAAEIVAYIEGVSGESDYLTFGPGEFGISVDMETKMIAELEGGRSGFMLKGVVDGAIVSTCTVMRPKRPRVRHVGEFGISVARSHWGLGVGKGMCLAMLEASREVGLAKVNLRVREDNAKAIRLYESVGFQSEGATVRAIKVGERYFTDLHMGVCLA